MVACINSGAHPKMELLMYDKGQCLSEVTGYEQLVLHTPLFLTTRLGPRI